MLAQAIRSGKIHKYYAGDSAAAGLPAGGRIELLVGIRFRNGHAAILLLTGR